MLRSASFTLVCLSVLTLACNQTNKKSDSSRKPAQTSTNPRLDVDNDDDPIVSDSEGDLDNSSGSDADSLPVETTEDDSDCYKTTEEICKIEKAILELVNAERQNPSGLFRRPKPPLKLSKNISFVARDWSKEQADRGDIGHDGFPGQRERVYQQEFGTNPDISAENVAMTGGGDAESVAQEFFDMWRTSPGHYWNMMGDYPAIGIGVAESGNGWYATQIFGDD